MTYKLSLTKEELAILKEAMAIILAAAEEEPETLSPEQTAVSRDIYTKLSYLEFKPD